MMSSTLTPVPTIAQCTTSNAQRPKAGVDTSPLMLYRGGFVPPPFSPLPPQFPVSGGLLRWFDYAAVAAAATALSGLQNNNNNNSNNSNYNHNQSAVNCKADRLSSLGYPFTQRHSALNKLGIEQRELQGATAPPLTPLTPLLPLAPRSRIEGGYAPPLSLAQNWCARCRTSFRMTSDLVYHMRSAHSRRAGGGPVVGPSGGVGGAGSRGRREGARLRCVVCAETFRERHHLTRHMTSHT